MSEPKKLREVLAEWQEQPRLRMGDESGKDAYDCACQLAPLVAALEAKVQKFRDCAETRIQNGRNSSSVLNREVTDARAETYQRCADELEADILGLVRGTR